jgi:hypothetical protein
MRMWMVNPNIMCRRHLLGEHVECHMILGAIKLKKSLNGFVKNNLIDTSQLENRHKALSEEMKRRGYKHKSNLKYNDKLNIGKVDINKSLKDLLTRCFDCNARHEQI